MSDPRDLDEEKLPPEILAWGGLRAALELHIRALSTVVDYLGVVKGSTRRKVSRAGAKHDFLVFCITKCCRMGRGITTLLDSFMAEESYPLTRTVYEHYLAIACVLTDERYLDEFLSKPIGLSVGTLQYPLSKSGKPVRRELIHPPTGIRFPGIASVGELARSTGYKYDAQLHGILYSYLSEHVHPNMLASGNYRDSTEKRYSYSETTGLLQAAFWAVLASALVISEVAKLVRAPSVAQRALREAANASRESLHESLSVMETTGTFASLPRLVEARLRARRRRKSV